MATTSKTTTEECDGKLHLFETQKRKDYHLREKTGTTWDKCDKQPCPNRLVHPRQYTDEKWNTPTQANGWLIQPPTCAGIHHAHNTALKRDQHRQDSTWVNCAEVFCPSRTFRRHTGTNLPAPHQVISLQQIPDHIHFEPYTPELRSSRQPSRAPSQASSRAPSRASHPIESVSQVFTAQFPEEHRVERPRTPHQEDVTIQAETPRYSQRTYTTNDPTKPTESHLTSISSISRHTAAYRQAQ